MHAELPEAFTEKIVARALEEDIGLGDVTTLATVPADRQCQAEVLARARAWWPACRSWRSSSPPWIPRFNSIRWSKTARTSSPVSP